MVKYLTAKQILLLHDQIIEEIGGLHGVRDHGVIASIVTAPEQAVFGKELYPDLFLKAAVYLREIALQHAFSDGNKRTAITVATVFLETNGYIATAKEGEYQELVLHTVTKKTPLQDIAAWLKKHSKKAN